MKDRSFAENEGMFSAADLITYTVSILILIVIPGPTMLYLMSRASLQGIKAGIYSLLGVNFADLVFILLVITGFSSVVQNTPFLFLCIRVLGSVYLLVLAYRMIRADEKRTVSRDTNLFSNRLKLFWTGFVINISNPKVIFFFIAVFSQFITPTREGVWRQNAILGVIFLSISFLVNLLFIGMSSFIYKDGHIHRIRIKQRFIVAAIFILIAVKNLI
ncbi:MAG: LysE family translocator [Sphingobacteriales bacterium]|nr:LysE family translocator [Sphingobacteriales bacterium]